MRRDDLEGLLPAVGLNVHNRHVERPPAKVNDFIRWYGDDASENSAIAAAVGSLMTRITSKPPSPLPASSPRTGSVWRTPGR